jgi:hypothetical protein
MFLAKGRKVSNNIWGIGRDSVINYLLTSYNFNTSLMIYNTITMNPIQIAITALALKFGIHPSVIIIILAFLL